MTLSDDKNRSKLDKKIKEVKQGIRSDHQCWLTKRKDRVISLGNEFVTFVSNPESICEEIKNCNSSNMLTVNLPGCLLLPAN